MSKPLIHIMFDAGENLKQSLELELLDTPPAQAWKELIQYYISNTDEQKLSTTDVVVSGTKEEMIQRWTNVRDTLNLVNHRYAKVNFRKLSTKTIDIVIDDLINIVSKGQTEDISVAHKISKAVEELKSLSYYFHNVDDDMVQGYEQINFGFIRHIPDPYMSAKFLDDWKQYLTLDIVPGTIYAELSYQNISWLELLKLENNLPELIMKLQNKEFSSPVMIENGFFIPFCADYAALKPDFYELIFKKEKLLKQYYPGFDSIEILSSVGRIPVARYNPELTYKQMFTQSDLTSINKLFKIEFYDSY